MSQLNMMLGAIKKDSQSWSAVATGTVLFCVNRFLMQIQSRLVVQAITMTAPNQRGSLPVDNSVNGHMRCLHIQ